MSLLPTRPYPLATLCLIAGACAGPSRTDPSSVVVPPPVRWGSASASGTVDPDWWHKLGSAALTAAIRRALVHNHDLQAAQARVAAAVRQAQVAGAARIPEFSLGGNAGRQRSVFVGFPGGSGRRPLVNLYNSFGVNLNAAWEVDLWGRLRAGRDAATAEARATLHDLRAARQSIAGQVAKAWFAAVEAGQQVALARTTAASYRASEAQVEDRFRRGVRPALDLRLARSRRMAAQARELGFAEQLQRAVRQLELLTGTYPAGRTELPEQLPVPTAPIPAGLPAELVRRRPDVRAAEERLVAAGFRVDEAQAALYPRLDLSGRTGTTSDDIKDLLDLDFLIWNAAANLVGPILDGGRRRNAAELAAARENEAIAAFAQRSLHAYTEVESLLAARGFLTGRLERLTAAEGESRRASVLAEERYRSGLGDFIAVLEAQRGALELSAQVLTARRLLLDLRVDLHLALGGGFEHEGAKLSP
ncbi:MAG: efflux transporter outer membrane subunit [Planctomycetes bacterium]|nr:efflux transporter outer membrane subunit [Planctomycetota bacterium]MCB9868849.1 efflux transporter outer membrane subunit [Planctomycetota bacterium]MCB9889563.1 efflux transporter outer membrane subunit [Planctomycetota bacterium]